MRIAEEDLLELDPNGEIFEAPATSTYAIVRFTLKRGAGGWRRLIWWNEIIEDSIERVSYLAPVPTLSIQCLALFSSRI